MEFIFGFCLVGNKIYEMERGIYFVVRVVVFVGIGFNDIVVFFVVCVVFFLNVERNCVLENYFYGVVMFIVFCCFCLKVF